ncbi:MAG: acetylhydrolase [Gammaproteobacteria bacterium]|nr:acetylhydrolase [Gammaproteobacteria bacterium]
MFLMAGLLGCQSLRLGEANSTKLAVPDTPYAVGSSTFFIHDDSRPYDSVAGVDVGVRSLLTEIWYPVSHAEVAQGQHRLATYGDYVFGDREIHRLMMTQTTFFHLTPTTVVEGVDQQQIDQAIDELFDRQRNSFIDAPLAASSQPWPVVVMTHGDAGSRYNMETACEYLAAHGYVVIAPEHTGNSPFSMTGKDPALNSKLADVIPYLNADGTYGKLEKYGQTYTPLINDRSNPQALINLDNSLLERVNDLRATLARLDNMNQQGRFAGRLALTKIGLMGRSFGGTTTLAALSLEPRFTAGVAVVPLVMADVRGSLPKQTLKPAGAESVILAADGPTALNTLSKPTMLLSGAEDGLIIGAGAGMAQAMGAEMPSPANPLPALRAAYQSSSQPVFWGLLEDSNHASFGVSGGYWWPQYKSRTQARYFEPQQQFNLINAEIAHEIQRRKVHQFFDVMIRGDESRKQALLENQFAEQGLQFEVRNF